MKIAPESIAFEAANARFELTGTLEALEALEIAERAYFAAEKIAREKLESFGADLATRGEENAYETEGTEGDKLYFLRIAAATAQEIVDCNL